MILAGDDGSHVGRLLLRLLLSALAILLLASTSWKNECGEHRS